MFAACSPSSQQTRVAKKTSNSEVAEDPVFLNDRLSWHTENKNSNNLILSHQYSSIIYLRGKELHNYLKEEKNKESIFCLSLNFDNPLSKNQLRFRAIPIKFRNYERNSIEHLLRIDTNLSTTQCNGTINSINGLSISSISLQEGTQKIVINTFGTSGNSIYIKESTNNNFTSFTPLKSENFLTYDSWNNGQDFYIATSSGLFISSNSGATFSNKTISDALPSNQITSVDAHGNFIIIGSNSGIAISSNQGETFLSKTQSNNLSFLMTKDVYINGSTIIVATEQGTYYSRNTGSTFVRLNNRNSSHISTNGSHYFISTQYGLETYDLNFSLVRILDRTSGLPSNNATTSFATSNYIYAGTSSGLGIFNLNGELVETITTKNSLDNNYITGVVEANNYVYISTRTKLYQRSFTTPIGDPFEVLPPVTFATNFSDLCLSFSGCRELISDSIFFIQNFT